MAPPLDARPPGLLAPTGRLTPAMPDDATLAPPEPAPTPPPVIAPNIAAQQAATW